MYFALTKSRIVFTDCLAFFLKKKGGKSMGKIGIKVFFILIISLIFASGTIASPLILLALGAGLVSRMLYNKPGVYRILRIACGFIIIFFGTQLILNTF